MNVLCQVSHSRKDGPRKKKYKRRERKIRKAKKATEKSVLFTEEEKATLCQRADDQLKVLDLQESDYRTDNAKSQKVTSELCSIIDKVSNKAERSGNNKSWSKKRVSLSKRRCSKSVRLNTD